MILNHFSWKYTEGVPIRNCDEIILYANTKKEEERLALTGVETDKKIESIKDLNPEEIKDLKKRRISNVIWLDEKWIYKLIYDIFTIFCEFYAIGDLEFSTFTYSINSSTFLDWKFRFR